MLELGYRAGGAAIVGLLTGDGLSKLAQPRMISILKPDTGATICRYMPSWHTRQGCRRCLGVARGVVGRRTARCTYFLISYVKPNNCSSRRSSFLSNFLSCPQ